MFSLRCTDFFFLQSFCKVEQKKKQSRFSPEKFPVTSCSLGALSHSDLINSLERRIEKTFGKVNLVFNSGYTGKNILANMTHFRIILVRKRNTGKKASCNYAVSLFEKSLEYLGNLSRQKLNISG